MNPALARILTRLYPRLWRERYGEEFQALLVSGDPGPRAALNVVTAAVREHLLPSPHRENPGASFEAVLKKPSALVPIAMSLAALATVLIHIALYGIAREADEGVAAHIWQLLMAAQFPVLIWFALRWLPKAPRPALGVLALQAGAICASLAPVFFLNL